MAIVNLISQAPANLVDNAIKYSEPGICSPGQTAAEIVVQATNGGDRVLLTVADNGPRHFRTPTANASSSVSSGSNKAGRSRVPVWASASRQRWRGCTAEN